MGFIRRKTEENDGDELFEFYEKEKWVPKPWMKSLLFIAVIWVLMNIFAAVYTGLSRNVYFWDAATYWDITRGIASGSIKHSLWDIYNSISTQDYNYVAALPGAVWAKVFGESRMAYVLGLVNMYLMPALAAAYALIRRFSKGEKLSLVLIILLLPMLLFMTVIGFTDVGGMLPCLLCMWLYFTRNEKKTEPLRYITLGVLLVFVMLWRRWFAFFSVSFLTAMAADMLIFRKKPMPVIITALTSGIILILFFRDFVFQKLLADYGNLYSGYKFSISTDIKLVMRYFGLITLLGLAAGSIAAGVRRKEKRTVFLWFQMLVCFIMFTSTQTHGQQHLLLYVPSLIMLAAILIKHIDKVWLLGALAVVGVFNSVNVYIPREQPNSIREIKHYALIPDFSMRPIVRSDIDELISLKQSLDARIEDGKTLGVLASSFTINEDILRNIEPSMGIKQTREDYIYGLPQVDSRDKDVTALYNVNYMLVAVPAQTHLEPENQKVVTEAVNSFIYYADFATAYEEIPEAQTELNGIELKLYKRVKEVPQADMVTFERRLEE